MRVLGRVERFRDRLQLDVRTLEPAQDVDPAAMAPAMRRDADELEGFLEFLVAEISHAGLARAVVQRVLDNDTRAAMRALPATIDGHHSYAGGLLEHTVGVATLCRETAQLHPRLRIDLLLAAALVHDVGRTRELGRGPVFRPTDEGRLLGHVHLGLRLIEERGGRRSIPACARSCCTQSRATTTYARRGPPRRRCSTTRTSSTQSPRPARFPSDGGSARAGREPHVGLRRLRRRRSARAACRSSSSRPSSQGAGLAVAAVRSSSPRTTRCRRRAQLAWAAFAGAIGVVGLASFYRALAVGAMGIVGPITATAAIVPVAYGLARGERPSTLQGAGVALAIVGVVAASLERTPDRRGRQFGAGVGLALAAALCFGWRAHRPEPGRTRRRRLGRS